MVRALQATGRTSWSSTTCRPARRRPGRVTYHCPGQRSGPKGARRVMTEHGVAGVIHIAAKKQVGESMADPLMLLPGKRDRPGTLLEACRDHSVDRFVFSSSAATYGLPDVDLVTEETPGVPLSPLRGEQAHRRVDDERVQPSLWPACMAFRYFNVAGAATPELGDPGGVQSDPAGVPGARRRRAAQGLRHRLPDSGRHLYPRLRPRRRHRRRALSRGASSGQGAESATYNIGRGTGSSVLEVLDVIAQVTDRDTTPEPTPRRDGDPARVVRCPWTGSGTDSVFGRSTTWSRW